MKSQAEADQRTRRDGFPWLVLLHVVTSLTLIIGTIILIYKALASSSVIPPPQIIKPPSDLQAFADAHTKGDPAAHVALIIYSDFECPFCRRLAREIIPRIEDGYVRNGRVLPVFRHFPISGLHPSAMAAARIAECAAEQGRFWQTHDEFFRLTAPLDAVVLAEAAQRAGVDSPALEQCLIRGQSDEVLRDLKIGRSIGVTGTPYMLVGRMTPRGVHVIRVIDGFTTPRVITDALELALSADAK